MYRANSLSPIASTPSVNTHNQIQALNSSVLGEDLTPEERSCLFKLSKFELFGGRIKKRVVSQLVREVGQDAVMQRWKMSKGEYDLAMESIEGKALASMPASIKNSLINSRYGFNEKGLEMNFSQQALTKHQGTVSTASG